MADVLKDEIFVIATGGTIDSVERTWPKPKGPQLVTLPHASKVCEFMKEVKADPVEFGLKSMPAIKYEQNEIFVDSSQFDRDAQEKLAFKLEREAAKYVIITCGTDDMLKLARRFKELFKDSGMVIQFTGAMTPLANGISRNDEWDVTDGYDNLKGALENINNKILKPGVYVHFHRETHDPENIEKDFLEGKFVQKEEFYKKYVRPGEYKITKFAERETGSNSDPFKSR